MIKEEVEGLLLLGSDLGVGGNEFIGSFFNFLGCEINKAFPYTSAIRQDNNNKRIRLNLNL